MFELKLKQFILLPVGFSEQLLHLPVTSAHWPDFTSKLIQHKLSEKLRPIHGEFYLNQIVHSSIWPA